MRKIKMPKAALPAARFLEENFKRPARLTKFHFDCIEEKFSEKIADAFYYWWCGNAWDVDDQAHIRAIWGSKK